MCEEYQNSDIYVASNVLDNKLCDELIRIYNIHNKSADSNCVCLNRNEYNNTDFKVYKKLRELLLKIFDINKYININADEGYILYSHHHESILKKEPLCTYEKYYNNLINSLIIFININDNEQEATFKFPEQEISLKIEKGSAILFPPYWTHPYKITGTSKRVLYLKVFMLEYCCP